MKVSLSWLKDYIAIETDIYRLADALTMAGLEIEAVSDRYEYLNSVVVGRIDNIIPHPNADKLKFCRVDVGDRIIPVVCGAANISENLLVPVALPGTRLVDGTLLCKTSIRGKDSEGMICSEAELGLGPESKGIMILKSGLPTGERLAKAIDLFDPVFEIDLTPNRPDCLSIIGIAREIAAIQKTSIRYPGNQPDNQIETIDNIADYTSVSIKARDHCPRYCARLVLDIKVFPSPFWLQDRLLSVGLKPVNNIVDITNFVMMDIGQPLHAFDFDRLAENRIVVRTAKEGEIFTTLDRKEQILSSDMLMICDGEKPVALAGVMGGSNSEIEESSTRVLVESAYFSPVSIRKTSKKLGINTESSHRFERGVDPNGTITALNRAARLMAEIGCGRLISGTIDERFKTPHSKTIALSVAKTNRVLGTSLTRNKMGNLLESIECNVNNSFDNQDKLVVKAPSFRVDISKQVDLIEEIARLSGYNNIPATFPVMRIKGRRDSKQHVLRDRLKILMAGFGFTEAINYTFFNKDSCDRLELEADDPRRSLVNIINPLSKDQAVMRTSLIPGLLEVMHHNLSRHAGSIKLFEIGKIFLNSGKNSLPEESEILAGLWTGSRYDASWHFKEAACDFYDIKGVVEGLAGALQLNNTHFTMMPDDLCSYMRPGYTARIVVENGITGLVGQVRPQALNNFDLSQPAFIFEINLDTMTNCMSDVKLSKPIPRFPSIARDITMIINRDIESRIILDSVKALNQELVENLYLFDVYAGDSIPPGEKSISFRIIYRSSFKTLEDDEVNHIHHNITKQIVKEFDATLPA